jgi:hypothetical protein
MTITTKIFLILITAGVGFLIGMIKLGINRLIKGQDDAKLEGKKRVRRIRKDIRDIGIQVARHNTKIAVIESKCDINHGRRKDD